MDVWLPYSERLTREITFAIDRMNDFDTLQCLSSQTCDRPHDTSVKFRNAPQCYTSLAVGHRFIEVELMFNNKLEAGQVR